MQAQGDSLEEEEVVDLMEVRSAELLEMVDLEVLAVAALNNLLMLMLEMADLELAVVLDFKLEGRLALQEE